MNKYGGQDNDKTTKGTLAKRREGLATEVAMDLKPIDQLVDLSQKRAVITGGAVGIGQGISYRLAEAGAKVLIADISEQNIAEAQRFFKDHDWPIEYVLADVSKPEDVDKIFNTANEKLGGLDILVNNAGIYPNILIKDMSLADFDKILSVNLKGTFMTTKAATEQMIKQGSGGRIVNVTSIDALHPSSIGLAHYDASKHAVWGFTKNAALEFAPHNIWINAVAPGGIATPGVQNLQKGMDLPEGVDMSAVLENFLRRIPMRRMGEPDDIAKAVLFLASDMSTYMTGSQLVVDGGVLLT